MPSVSHLPFNGTPTSMLRNDNVTCSPTSGRVTSSSRRRHFRCRMIRCHLRILVTSRQRRCEEEPGSHEISECTASLEQQLQQGNNQYGYVRMELQCILFLKVLQFSEHANPECRSMKIETTATRCLQGMMGSTVLKSTALL